jgi:hypothetical protein
MKAAELEPYAPLGSPEAKRDEADEASPMERKRGARKRSWRQAIACRHNRQKEDRQKQILTPTTGREGLSPGGL